jgi:hypothetical protein
MLHRNFRRLSLAITCVALGSSARLALADPLPGEVAKFDQEPLINVPIQTATGAIAIYNGHDEESTAYIGTNPLNNQPDYSGPAMADDFSDTKNTPVVHISWWGSYMNTVVGTTVNQVQRFLISFESDVPANSASGFSTPGQVLSSQIVTIGAAPTVAGTFTQTQVPGVNSVDGAVYKYNAELATPFPEKANTVYWLKIVALVNQSPTDPTAPIWGWHDRDYTQQDLLASPAVTPGEVNLGTAASPIWHFQDDAVTSAFSADISTANNSLTNITETNFRPENYIDNVDGPPGIGQFSKDLSFVLYTVVPEPTSLSLMMIGALPLLRRRRR